MNISIAVLTGLESLRIDTAIPIPCEAAVFTGGYKECRNRAIKKRGKWALCGPHGRLEELEVVDKP